VAVVFRGEIFQRFFDHISMIPLQDHVVDTSRQLAAFFVVIVGSFG
jgi:hypothetical protein